MLVLLVWKAKNSVVDFEKLDKVCKIGHFGPKFCHFGPLKMIQSKWHSHCRKRKWWWLFWCEKNKIHLVDFEKLDKVCKIGHFGPKLGHFDPLKMIQSKWHLHCRRRSSCWFFWCEKKKIHLVDFEKLDKVCKIGHFGPKLGHFDPLKMIQSKWRLHCRKRPWWWFFWCEKKKIHLVDFEKIVRKYPKWPKLGHFGP